jgi:acetoin utilization deacetylase AcuC-like enzyme
MVPKADAVLTEDRAHIPVYYSERLLADADSFSPSAGKPRQVLAAWQEAGLPIAVQPITPAAELDICLAHDPIYVHGVLTGTLPNGFGNQRTDVARSLPYTTGAMIAAARAALDAACACAPVSGFHHAHYDSGGGFCTFNGLIIAAQKLIAGAEVQRILILDCDMHYGDGTEQIIEKLALQHCIENCTFGRWFDSPSDAPAYLAKLCEAATRFDDYDLILYQAGADVHVDDPLGGVLTTSQMIERDRIVFEAARKANVPIAWNLAGGYQEPLGRVIGLHVHTMQECARVYCPDQPTADAPARRSP